MCAEGPKHHPILIYMQTSDIEMEMKKQIQCKIVYNGPNLHNLHMVASLAWFLQKQTLISL